VDYGAAVKATTIESILELKNVDGVLIGSAANDPLTLRPIIEKVVEYVRINPSKNFNLGINWKANDTANGLKDLDEFISMFKSLRDIERITVTIATPNPGEARAAMDRVENYILKSSVGRYGMEAYKTVDIGNGFTAELIHRAEGIPAKASIENLFQEARARVICTCC